MKNFLNKAGKVLSTVLSLPLIGLLVISAVPPITISCILALLQGELKTFCDKIKNKWKLFKFGFQKIAEGNQIRITSIDRIDDLTKVDSMEIKTENIY